MLNHNDFRTDGDKRDAYAEAQYQRGLALAAEGAVVHISLSGSWSAELPSDVRFEEDGRVWHNHRNVTASETLGYHRNTAQLVQGWLDGGALVVDHREDVRGVVVT